MEVQLGEHIAERNQRDSGELTAAKRLTSGPIQG